MGKSLRSEGVLGNDVTVLLVATYLMVGFCHSRAVIRKYILWVGKDEDVSAKEGHYKHDCSVRKKSWLAIEGVDIEQMKRKNSLLFAKTFQSKRYRYPIS
jgi:hypothetical protein